MHIPQNSATPNSMRKTGAFRRHYCVYHITQAFYDHPPRGACWRRVCRSSALEYHGGVSVPVGQTIQGFTRREDVGGDLLVPSGDCHTVTPVSGRGAYAKLRGRGKDCGECGRTGRKKLRLLGWMVRNTRPRLLLLLDKQMPWESAYYRLP